MSNTPQPRTPGVGPDGPDARRHAAQYRAEQAASEPDDAVPESPDADEGGRGGASPRPRMSVQNIETWVDQSIRQAQREGKFDDLPGAGKPLASLTSTERLNDPDWFVKNLAERENLDLSGAMPSGMALRRERSTYPEALATIRDETVVRDRLEDFNERVLADRRVPHVGPTSPPVVGRVDVVEMLERWRALRAERALVEPGTPSEVDTPSEQNAPLRRPRRWWWRRGADG